MKTRIALVSNSSTSSFQCEICGAIEADRDLCISDAGMATCEKGHTFHFPEICDKELAKKFIIPEDGRMDECEDLYEIPSKYCPICQLAFIPDKMVLDYVLTKFNLNKEDIQNEIRKEKMK